MLSQVAPINEAIASVKVNLDATIIALAKHRGTLA